MSTLLFDGADCRLVLKEVHVNSATYKCLWIGLVNTPTIPELRELERHIVAAVDTLDGHPVVLHLEHVSDWPLRLPSVDEFRCVVDILTSRNERVKRTIHCTVVQAQAMDLVTELGKNILFAMYTPEKPFFVCAGPQAVVRFLEDVC